jgi:hypothetical protein
LGLDPENHLTVVDTIADLVPAIIHGVRQPAAKGAQAQRGRQAVIANHDWDRIAVRLEQVWADCLTDCRAAR